MVNHVVTTDEIETFLRENYHVVCSEVRCNNLFDCKSFSRSLLANHAGGFRVVANGKVIYSGLFLCLAVDSYNNWQQYI